jgi:hypothetical protein
MTSTRIKSALILSAWSLVGLSALARADVFGIPGQPGAPGADGYVGAAGQNVSVVATGQEQSFNLRGQNGGNGANGQPGAHATACRQPPAVRADFFGAPGGNGGNGGNGGAGGNGGSITVYYTDLTALKQISIDSTPGVGGAPGYGAPGDDGCRCDVREWTVPVQVCHQVTPPAPAPVHSGAPAPTPTPTTVCNTEQERHVCQDGPHGDNGANFAGGASGQYGSATLIQSLTPLTPTNPNGNAQMGSLPAQMTLTADNWSTSTGAAALFAPNSVIQDTYAYWAGRKTVQTSVVWNASTPQSSCTSQAVMVQVNGSGQVSANIENTSVWAELAVSYANDGSATVSVNKAVPANQAAQLSASLSGNDSGLVDVLNDAAKVSNIVDTQVQAKVLTPGFLGIMTTRFNGQVPANLLSINDSQVIVEVGKLPGISAGDLKKGKKIKVQLTITRSLGGQSANQELDLEQKI